MRARARIRIAVVAATGMLGLFAAHAADYVIVVRDRAARMALLTRTGHAYLGRAVEMAVVAAVIAFIACIALGFRRPREGWSSRSRMRAVAALALIQSGAFVAVEAAERITAGAIGQRLVFVTIVGIALQIVAAVFAVVAISMLEHTVDAIARAFRSRPDELRAAAPSHAARANLALRPISARRIPARAPPLRG